MHIANYLSKGKKLHFTFYIFAQLLHVANGKNRVQSKGNEADTRKQWKGTIEPDYNKIYFFQNCQKKKKKKKKFHIV